MQTAALRQGCLSGADGAELSSFSPPRRPNTPLKRGDLRPQTQTVAADDAKPAPALLGCEGTTAAFLSASQQTAFAVKLHK